MRPRAGKPDAPPPPYMRILAKMNDGSGGT